MSPCLLNWSSKSSFAKTPIILDIKQLPVYQLFQFVNPALSSNQYSTIQAFTLSILFELFS